MNNGENNSKKNKVPIKVRFLIHIAPAKNRRKIFILMGVEKKQSKKIQNCINEAKNVGKCWDSNPYLARQNPVVLPTLPREPLEFLTNVNEIIKLYGPTEIRTVSYCLRNFCLHRTAKTIYLKIKVVGKNTLIK